MNAQHMTKNFFTNCVLPQCEFQLMSDGDRMAFAGAGEWCLIAEVQFKDDEFTVLTERGSFEVFGFDEDGEQWCFSFLDDGLDGQFSQLF